MNPSRPASLPPPLDEVRVAVEIDIPSDVRYIERIVDLVKCQCEQLEYAPRQCALNVPVALAEALSNAILRGNKEDPGKHVTVRADVDQRQIVLEIADEGAGFDLAESTHDPTDPEGLLREDGRGLFLMQKLMDRVERVGAGRNTVRMVLLRK